MATAMGLRSGQGPGSGQHGLGAYLSNPPLLQGADYEEFKTTAQKVEDVPFAQTTDAKVAKAAGLTKPGIAVLKNFVGG